MTGSPTATESLRRETRRLAREVARAVDGRFGLACSGGTDSTALLLVATEALQNGWIEPFVVVHVNHRTRPESGAEGAIVAVLCRRLSVPCVRVQVAESGPAPGESPEARLRVLRYDALASVVRRLGLEGILTAHTRNDQFETILMRLFGGAGGSHLAGMRRYSMVPVTGGSLRVVRPLLDVTRSDLESLVRAAGITVIDDPTNRDLGFRRNAVRHAIVPAIEEHFTGAARAVIRTAALIERDAELLDRLATATSDEVARQNGAAIAIDRRWARTGEPAIVARVLRRAALALSTSDARDLGLERVEALRLAAGGRTGAEIELPGGVVARIGRTEIVLIGGSDDDRAK